MASKHIMHLEQRLSTRLLNRTSRHVSLSETGAVYLEQVNQTLIALEEAEAVVSKATIIPHGTLKLSAPVWMANSIFAHLLAEYQSRYPQVLLDIDLSGRLVNLVDEGFDLALRLTRSVDEGLIARPLSKTRFHLVAAPSYLKQHGHPTSMEELDGHRLLMYTLGGFESTIKFNGVNGKQTVKLTPVLQSTNEQLLHLAAIQGMGLAFLPKFLVEEDIKAKRLELLLAEQFTFEGTLHGVYSSRKYLSAKVRTFLEFFTENAKFA